MHSTPDVIPENLMDLPESELKETTSSPIELRQVNYRYQEESFLFDLSVPKGAIMALLGASGSGKSTMLSLIAGFIEPEAGEVFLNQINMTNQPPHQRPLAFLFQAHNLFEHLTVRQNIGLGIHSGLKLTQDQELSVKEAAEQVGLGNYLERLPEQLSGGQKQRIALARCFIQPHDIWLLDEPFSALDPLLRSEMLALVKQLANERNATVIMVTHHLSDALSLANSFAFMYQGKITEIATIEALSKNSNNPQVVEFVNKSEGRTA